MLNRKLSQQTWASISVEARVALLSRVRAALAGNLDHWVSLLCECRGCGPAEALSSEILPLLDAIQFLERRAAKLLAPSKPSKKLLPYWLYGVELEVRRRPWGTVMVLGPGNYPLFLPGVQALQALAAGNAVLLKPQVGKEAPLKALVSLLVEQGLPSALVEVLDSSPATAQRAIREGLDKVVITGSLTSGQAVLATAAQHVTPVTAELSGADLVWVGPQADLDLLAKALRWGLSLNAGNTCMSPRRVLGPAADLARLEALLDLHPLGASPAHPLIEQALSQGARWKNGYLSQVNRSCQILTSHEAPALCLIPVESETEGLDIAELSPYGLGASLFGSPTWAEGLASRLKVGFVTINDIIAPTADPRMPFGGRKASGFGVTRGDEGLLEMTVPQALSRRTSGPYYHLESPSAGDYPILAHYARFAHGNGGSARFWSFLRMLGWVARERLRRRLGR